MQEERPIYYVSNGKKAFFTFLEPKGEAWVIKSEFIIPYLVEWPDLMRPQTIH